MTLFKLSSASRLELYFYSATPMTLFKLCNYPSSWATPAGILGFQLELLLLRHSYDVI